MINNISLFTLYVTDQEASKRFYVDVLGFEERIDVAMGPDFRWVTVGHPSQPELDVTLMIPVRRSTRGWPTRFGARSPAEAGVASA